MRKMSNMFTALVLAAASFSAAAAPSMPANMNMAGMQAKVQANPTMQARLVKAQAVVAANPTAQAKAAVMRGRLN